MDVGRSQLEQVVLESLSTNSELVGLLTDLVVPWSGRPCMAPRTWCSAVLWPRQCLELCWRHNAALSWAERSWALSRLLSNDLCSWPIPAPHPVLYSSLQANIFLTAIQAINFLIWRQQSRDFHLFIQCQLICYVTRVGAWSNGRISDSYCTRGFDINPDPV